MATHGGSRTLTNLTAEFGLQRSTFKVQHDLSLDSRAIYQEHSVGASLDVACCSGVKRRRLARGTCAWRRDIALKRLSVRARMAELQKTVVKAVAPVLNERAEQPPVADRVRAVKIDTHACNIHSHPPRWNCQFGAAPIIPGTMRGRLIVLVHCDV
jgi:hypothetical protein